MNWRFCRCTVYAQSDQMPCVCRDLPLSFNSVQSLHMHVCSWLAECLIMCNGQCSAIWPKSRLTCARCAASQVEEDTEAVEASVVEADDSGAAGVPEQRKKTRAERNKQKRLQQLHQVLSLLPHRTIEWCSWSATTSDSASAPVWHAVMHLAAHA